MTIRKVTIQELVPVGTRPTLGRYLIDAVAGRVFLREMVRAKVEAEYSNALLGPAWLLVTPLLNSLLYFVVFGLLLGAQGEVDNYPLFLLTGVLLYTFVARSASAATTSLQRQRDFVRTIPFPRMLLVLSAAGTEVRYLSWSLLVLAGAALVTAGVQATWLLAMAAVVLLVVLSTGLGLMLARLNAMVPDTAGLLPFALRAGGYLSGAYFPLAAVGSAVPWLGSVLEWNPVAIALTLVRVSLEGQAAPWAAWACLGGWAVVSAVFGVITFWRGEPGYGRA